MPSSNNLGRETAGVRLVSGLASDLRYAARRLSRERGFTAIAGLTLALCIGANTAIFSMLYGLILKPLPFPEPTRIVQVFNNFPKAGLTRFPSNLVQYTDFKANTSSFDSIGLFTTRMVLLGQEGSAERILGAQCTADMFAVLGIHPVIGQFFSDKNCRPGEDDVVVLAESFWRAKFNEDPGVLNRPVRIDGRSYRIIGVAPRSLDAFNAQAKFLTPVAWDPKAINPGMRYACTLELYARLKPEANAAGALGQLSELEQRFYEKAIPMFKAFLDRTGHTVSVGLVQAERVQPIKSSLYLLQGGVVFVLLIGCVNVANLLLARANGRRGELAIRAALGAGRGAIARQLFVESFLLTFLGTAVGVGIAYGAVHVIDYYTAKLLPNMLPVAIDGRVLACTLAAAGCVGLLIGVLPVVHALRSDLAAVIHQSSRSVSGGRGLRALSSVLVSGEIAVALILLCGAGLLIHSFLNAISVAPGFDPSHVVVGSVALPSTYQDKAKAAAVQRRIERALGEIPGVEGAALASGIPFEGNLPVLALTLKDGSLPRDAPQPGAFLIGVSLDYFRTLRIPFLKGRPFGEPDLAAGLRPVYIVDQRFEERYFSGKTALGGHFSFGGTPDKESQWPEIVGVVGNVPHNGIEDTSGNPFAYYPLLTDTPGGLNLFVRSSRPTGDLLTAVREKIRAVDPAIVLFDGSTARRAIDESLDDRRAVMLLLGCFAALALFLASIGIYGVLAYDVSQRTREIGIRGAIGATAAQIEGLVMRQGLWRIGIGLAVGLASAVLLSRYLQSMLFEIKASDPWSYAAVSLALAGVAVAASYIPARRAARIDPIESLRAE